MLSLSRAVRRTFSMSSCQRFLGRPCCLEVRALVSSGFHLAARFDHLDSFCEATRRAKFHLCLLCAVIQSSIVSRRSLSSASWVVRLMKSTQGSRQSSFSSGSSCKSVSVGLLSASLSLSLVSACCGSRTHCAQSKTRLLCAGVRCRCRSQR